MAAVPRGLLDHVHEDPPQADHTEDIVADRGQGVERLRIGDPPRARALLVVARRRPTRCCRPVRSRTTRRCQPARAPPEQVVRKPALLAPAEVLDGAEQRDAGRRRDPRGVRCETGRRACARRCPGTSRGSPRAARVRRLRYMYRARRDRRANAAACLGLDPLSVAGDRVLGVVASHRVPSRSVVPSATYESKYALRIEDERVPAVECGVSDDRTTTSPTSTGTAIAASGSTSHDDEPVIGEMVLRACRRDGCRGRPDRQPFAGPTSCNGIQIVMYASGRLKL